MADYRRWYVPGGTFFFTVVTQGRAEILCDPPARAILGAVFRQCRQQWPFQIEAIVLLPEHLHTIWTLPEGDEDYSRRWGWLKKEFTGRWLAAGGNEQEISASRRGRRRRGVWQPRFWEHMIRDEQDLKSHLDYVHYNPVKHGRVECPRAWPYSSFHRWVRLGEYSADWGCLSSGPIKFADLRMTAIE